MMKSSQNSAVRRTTRAKGPGKLFRLIAALFSRKPQADSGHALGEHIELPREFLDAVVTQDPVRRS